jgi:hypothetical protein
MRSCARQKEEEETLCLRARRSSSAFLASSQIDQHTHEEQHNGTYLLEAELLHLSSRENGIHLLIASRRVREEKEIVIDGLKAHAHTI